MSVRIQPKHADAMLVHGNGVRYGLTDLFIYSIEQVLCIFEVKKTLTKSDLSDAMDHLKSVKKAFSTQFEEKLRKGNFEPQISVAQKLFGQITGKSGPDTYMEIHNLPKNEGLLFYTLVQETHSPICIIHGYGGYKKESGLRNAFLDCIKHKRDANSTGIGVPFLPNLILSNDFCVVKTNGLPFFEFTKGGEWAVMCSTRHNPIQMLMEIIWSKISVYFDLRMPWGEDLSEETIYPLLFATPRQVQELSGWEYRFARTNETLLKERVHSEEWRPIEISPDLVNAFELMSMRGGELDKDALTYIAKEFDLKPDDIRKKLLETRLFMIDNFQGVIRPINKKTFLHSFDDNSGLITDDENRLSNWCKRKEIEPSLMVLILVHE